MKKMLKKIKSKNEQYHIGLILYAFCFLFAPPILPDINFVLVLAIYSFFMILIKYRSKIKNIFKNNYIKKCIFILIIYFSIYVVSIIINGLLSDNWPIGNYIINIYAFVLAFPVTFLCSFYMIFRCEELDLNYDSLISIFIKAGLLQAFLCILSLLVPVIKKFFVDIMYINTGTEQLGIPWIVERRFFGFSNSMLDLFGFGTGIIAAISLFYGLSHSRLYLIITPLLLAVPFLNSRSGLVIFAIGFILFLICIFSIKRFKKLKKYILFGGIGIVLLAFLVYLLSPNTIDWIIKDFSSFFTKNDGTASVLFSEDFWELPPLQNWIIGTGYSVSAYSDFAVSGIAHSDVGYINELWKVGILGSLALYYFVFYFIKKMFFCSKKIEYRIMTVFFLISIIVFMVKCSIFTYNPGCTIIYTLGLMLFLKEDKKNINKKVMNMELNNNIEIEPLVSVVVPIYNVEKYLQKCISSLRNQTYKNIEILLINDGTQDNSLEICDKNVKEDKRVKVISQRNGGLSKARNTGLNNAIGEYICFVDSDDYVDEHYIEYMIKSIIENDADICACDFYYVNETGETWVRKQKNNKIFSATEALQDIFSEDQETEIMTWNKLYKRSLFTDNKIKFPEGKLHEDNFTTYKLYYFSKKITLINDKLYYYLQRNNSIMGKSFNKKRLDILVAVEEAKKFIKKKNLQIELSFESYELSIIINLINTMIRDRYDGPEKEELITKIYNNKKRYLKNKYVSKKNRTLIRLLGKKGNLYSKLLLSKDKRKKN